MTTPSDQEMTRVRTGSGPVRTEYVLVRDAQGNTQKTKQTSISNEGRAPKGMPRFLADRSVLFMAWGASMILIGFDEWHNNGILPRPARLWHASVVYGLLALVSGVDAVVPVANALGVGYTIVLLWQYYNKGGAFGGSGGTAQDSQTTVSSQKKPPKAGA